MQEPFFVLFKLHCYCCSFHGFCALLLGPHSYRLGCPHINAYIDNSIFMVAISRAVPRYRYRQVSAFFCGISIGKMLPILFKIIKN